MIRRIPKLSAWHCGEFVEKSVPQANVEKANCRHCTGFGRSQMEHFSAADSVEDTVISNQEKLLVQDAVNRLPEKLRIVVLLYYMENLK